MEADKIDEIKSEASFYFREFERELKTSIPFAYFKIKTLVYALLNELKKQSDEETLLDKGDKVFVKKDNTFDRIISRTDLYSNDNDIVLYLLNGHEGYWLRNQLEFISHGEREGCEPPMLNQLFFEGKKYRLTEAQD